MKIQLQIYHPGDLTAERTVVGTLEGTHTQDAIAAWSSGMIEKHGDLPEGQSFGMVPSDHAWFMETADKAVLGPNNAPKAVQQALTPTSKKRPSNDEVAHHRKMTFERQRLARLKKEAELKKFLASQN